MQLDPCICTLLEYPDSCSGNGGCTFQKQKRVVMPIALAPMDKMQVYKFVFQASHHPVFDRLQYAKKEARKNEGGKT